MRRSTWEALAGAAALAIGCRAPTQVHLDVSTDADCHDVTGTTITTGRLVALEDRPPTTETIRCDDTRIGSLVVVPARHKDAEFAIRVVTGFLKDPEQCVRDDYTGGCIVARRALSFIPHRTIELPIQMEAACIDIPCGETETCRAGRCVDATLPDPLNCTDPAGCDEPTGGAAGAAPVSGTGGAGAAAPNPGGRPTTTGGAAPSPAAGASGEGGAGGGGGLHTGGSSTATAGGPPTGGAAGGPTAGGAGGDPAGRNSGDGGVAGTTAAGGTPPHAIDQTCGTGLGLDQLDTDHDGTLDVLDRDDDGDGLTDSEECTEGPPTELSNGSFEIPFVPDGPARRGDQHFPGWTCNQLIPLWAGGHNGIPPAAGRQLVVPTGRGPLTLSQAFPTTPGSTVRWAFQHWAASGTDTIQVSIAGEPQGDFVASAPTWELHTGTWEVPSGVSQATLDLHTEDAGGSTGLVDAVAIELVCTRDSDGDGCPDSKDPDTQLPPNGFCGDGIVQPDRGEVCDEGGPTEQCDDDCTRAECGDQVVNPHAGEWCEQFTQERICNPNCSPSVCGDDIVNGWASETCDPGGTTTCDGDCTAAECGDGWVNPAAGEDCEAGLGECVECTQAIPLPIADAEVRSLRTEPFADQISLEWTLYKTGAGLPLASTELRYWFEPEDATNLEAVCDFAEVGCGFVQLAVRQNPHACAGATHYLEVTHTDAFVADATGLDYSLRIQDWNGGAFDFTNDYSRSPHNARKNADSRIGIYERGVLIAGEPPCGCGNGVLESGEACDHGGESAFCNADCSWGFCGDGVVNTTAGEECDSGTTADLDCDVHCTRTGMEASADGSLRVWLDASDPFAFFRGDRIWWWIDKKTRFEYRQDAASRQPAWVPGGLNGKPAVWFDGIDDLLVGEISWQTPDPIVDSATGTVFVVHRVEPGGEVAQLLGNGSSDSGGGWAIRTRPDGDGLGLALSASTGWSTEHWHADAFAPGPPTPGFSRLYWDPQFVGVARDGNDQFLIQSTTYRSAIAPLTLGGTDAGEPYRGYIGEILVFDRVLTVAELDSIEAYLAAKWGVR